MSFQLSWQHEINATGSPTILLCKTIFRTPIILAVYRLPGNEQRDTIFYLDRRSLIGSRPIDWSTVRSTVDSRVLGMFWR